MFGARKKFVEFVDVVDNDFTDESMYYNQPTMFPHRSDKDVSFVLVHLSYLLRFFSTFIVLSSVLECFPPDAVLSLTIVIGSAVAARCEFIWSTK